MLSSPSEYLLVVVLESDMRCACLESIDPLETMTTPQIEHPLPLE